MNWKLWSFPKAVIIKTWWDECRDWSAGTECCWLFRRDRQGIRGEAKRTESVQLGEELD